MKIKRKIEIAVVSDVHLGSKSCRAKYLLNYLNSIEPKKLILNGDIVNTWQFNKHYFPKSHLKVIKKIIDMSANGVEVVYITGNHDELLRKFSNNKIANMTIVDTLVLELHGKKAWFFHGDVFDISLRHAKWLAKLGSYGHRFLFYINRFVNWYLVRSGKERYSLSEKAKSEPSRIDKFEKTISNLAIRNGFDYVVCGHIHHPKMAFIENAHGKTTYLNSGDWVEHFTALEYQFKRWKVYHYNKDKLVPFFVDEGLGDMNINDLIAAITIVEQRVKKTKDR